MNQSITDAKGACLPPLPLTECGAVAVQNVERTLCLCQVPCMDTFKGLLHVFQVKEGRSGIHQLTPVAWPHATDPSASGHGWALSALAPACSPFLDAFSSGKDFGWQKMLQLSFWKYCPSFLIQRMWSDDSVKSWECDADPQMCGHLPLWRKLWNDLPSSWTV